MKNIIRVICLFILVFTVNIALARKPHPSPPPPEPANLMNVITVSAENGDFTSPVAAMNSIGETSLGNRFLIVIGPGVYEVSTAIIMKEWVTIQGAGQEATKITGAISTGDFPCETSAIVRGQNNAALTDLTIENRGGSVFSIAIYNREASPRIERVTAMAIGGDGYGTGIFNEDSSSPIITNVTASASGVAMVENFGVYNVFGSSPSMVNVKASASGAMVANFGVYNYFESSPTMVNVKASASGGLMRNPSILIKDAAPFIVDSVLDGLPGLALEGDSSDSRIVNNKIIGGVLNNTADGNVCRGNYNENLADVACLVDG